MKKEEKTVRKGSLSVKILLYAISAMLIMLYLVVLWWGQHPKVGIEYRMYYLTHELSDWPGYGKLSYQLGTKEYCTSLKDRNGTEVAYKVCQRKGQGWKKEQYEGSENNSTESFIYYLPKSSKAQAVYEFQVNSFEGTEAVAVYADDKQIGTFDSSGSFRFTIDEVTENELLTIKFVSDKSVFCLWSTQIS